MKLTAEEIIHLLEDHYTDVEGTVYVKSDGVVTRVTNFREGFAGIDFSFSRMKKSLPELNFTVDDREEVYMDLSKMFQSSSSPLIKKYNDKLVQAAKSFQGLLHALALEVANKFDEEFAKKVKEITARKKQ